MPVAARPWWFARDGEAGDVGQQFGVLLSQRPAAGDHLGQALRDEGTGRRLEFIAQEMHREANTMASKAGDPRMTEWIIDLRAEVDRIREQVLNLE